MRCLYPSLFDSRGNIEVWFCEASCCKGKDFHRDDGPAVVFPDGTEEWWQHGKRLTDAEVSALRAEFFDKEFHGGTRGPVKPMHLGKVGTTPSSGTPEPAMKKDDQEDR